MGTITRAAFGAAILTFVITFGVMALAVVVAGNWLYVPHDYWDATNWTAVARRTAIYTAIFGAAAYGSVVLTKTDPTGDMQRAYSFYRPRRRRAGSLLAFGVAHFIMLLLNATMLHGQFDWDAYMFWVSVVTVIGIAVFYVAQRHDDRQPASTMESRYTTPRQYDY